MFDILLRENEIIVEGGFNMITNLYNYVASSKAVILLRLLIKKEIFDFSIAILPRWVLTSLIDIGGATATTILLEMEMMISISILMMMNSMKNMVNMFHGIDVVVF
jgi:hypothetical protein